MRKTIFTILMISLAMSAGAQSLKVSYEETANIENQLKNVTDPEIRKRVSEHLSRPALFTLYYTNGASAYVEDKPGADHEQISMNDKKITRLEIGRDGGVTYKSQADKVYLRETNLLGKQFLITDQLSPINWKLTNETKKIGSYEARKATAAVNNETITAWYTPEIAVSDGPADYYGLPGLIIQLSSEKKMYNALKVTNEKADYNLIRPSNGKVVSKAEYLHIRDEKINELRNGNGNSLNTARP